jgi:hypothetical protein
MASDGRDVTSLFARMRHGDPEAVKGVLSELDAELRLLAGRDLGGERGCSKARLRSRSRARA